MIMATPIRLSVINVGYRSTNYWVISAGSSRILVDLGRPGMFGRLQANLKRMDVPLSEIKYAIATHFHIDHAGTGEELKQAGVQLLVIDLQLDSIPLMKSFTKPQDNYLEIKLDGNIVISVEESRQALQAVGIPGQIVHTPGHSDDSISVLLDDGRVFTGDLTRPDFIYQEDPEPVYRSWQRLWELGARQVYPGHGPDYPLDPATI